MKAWQRIQIGVATSLIVLSIGTGTAFKSKQAKYDADLNKAQVALNQKRDSSPQFKVIMNQYY